MDYKHIKNTIRKVVEMLVQDQYKYLYEHDFNKRINELEIKEAISGYGKITMPPSTAFDEIDVYETDDPSHVRIDFDLWFDGERSDITLGCSVYLFREHDYSIEKIRML